MAKHFFDGYFDKQGWGSVEEVTEDQLLETGARLKFIDCIKFLCQEHLMYNTIDKYVSAIKLRLCAKFPRLELELFDQGHFYTAIRAMFENIMNGKSRKENKKMRNHAETYTVDLFKSFLYR